MYIKEKENGYLGGSKVSVNQTRWRGFMGHFWERFCDTATLQAKNFEACHRSV